MASDEEQDVPERNIVYLKELKALLFAKNQLLKLNNVTTELNNHSAINTDNKRKKLYTSLLNQSNLDSAFFHVLLDLFIREHVVNNKSESTEFLEFKEKIYNSLQEMKKLTNYTQTLMKTLQTLEIKYEKVQEEVCALQGKHKRITEDNMKTVNKKKKNGVGEVRLEQKKQAMLRVEKINLMATIIKGLINARGVCWKKYPDLVETAKMCRNVYKLK